jgi:hypothetical protein
MKLFMERRSPRKGKRRPLTHKLANDLLAEDERWFGDSGIGKIH